MERILIGDPATPASEILVSRGLLPSGAAAAIAAAAPEADRVAILTQPGAAPRARELRRALASGGRRSEVRVVPDRDAAKTFTVAEEVYLWLNELALTRDDLVVGVGGGAVTDLAGFVAATYLRGVAAVHVPTTLLGAVDAAIGGKTGLNVGGKNLVGAFHHPRAVLIDPDILDGLPRPLLVEGTAEAVKCGFIADTELINRYEADGLDADLEEVVIRAARVKADVVSEDFREHGRRAILNYGHTVGHAVEIAAALPHGHAIAIGMVAAGAASRLMTGFAGEARQKALLERLELPTAAPDVDAATALGFMALDKKRRGSQLRMTLLEEFGRATVQPVDGATVDAALAAVGIG